MVGDAFGRPGVVEEVRAAEAGVGWGGRAGLEDALPQGLPPAVPAGSCFPCEVALEAERRAGLPCPVGFCSEAGLASLLAQQEEELKGREGGEEKRFRREGAKVKKEEQHVKTHYCYGRLVQNPAVLPDLPHKSPSPEVWFAQQSWRPGLAHLGGKTHMACGHTKAFGRGFNGTPKGVLHLPSVP